MVELAQQVLDLTVHVLHVAHQFTVDASDVAESLGGLGKSLPPAEDAGAGDLKRISHDHPGHGAEVRALVAPGDVVENVSVGVKCFLAAKSPHEPRDLR